LANVRLKEVEGKNEQDGRAVKEVSSRAVFRLDLAKDIAHLRHSSP